MQLKESGLLNCKVDDLLSVPMDVILDEPSVGETSTHTNKQDEFFSASIAQEMNVNLAAARA